MKVYVVLDMWDYTFDKVYATKEKAEEYVRIKDRELGRFIDLPNAGLSGLRVEEHEVTE